jgi:hypothetical protein
MTAKKSNYLPEWVSWVVLSVPFVFLGGVFWYLSDKDQRFQGFWATFILVVIFIVICGVAFSTRRNRVRQDKNKHGN